MFAAVITIIISDSMPEMKSPLETSSESDVVAYVSAMTPEQYLAAVYERALEMSDHYDKSEEVKYDKDKQVSKRYL